MNYAITSVDEYFDAQQKLRSEYPEALAFIEDNLGPVPAPGEDTSLEEMQQMIQSIHDICLKVGA